MAFAECVVGEELCSSRFIALQRTVGWAEQSPAPTTNFIKLVQQLPICFYNLCGKRTSGAYKSQTSARLNGKLSSI